MGRGGIPLAFVFLRCLTCCLLVAACCAAWCAFVGYEGTDCTDAHPGRECVLLRLLHISLTPCSISQFFRLKPSFAQPLTTPGCSARAARLLWLRDWSVLRRVRAAASVVTCRFLF